MTASNVAGCRRSQMLVGSVGGILMCVVYQVLQMSDDCLSYEG